MGYYNKKNCHPELSKLAQSGHSAWDHQIVADLLLGRVGAGEVAGTKFFLLKVGWRTRQSRRANDDVTGCDVLNGVLTSRRPLRRDRTGALTFRQQMAWGVQNESLYEFCFAFSKRTRRLLQGWTYFRQQHSLFVEGSLKNGPIPGLCLLIFVVSIWFTINNCF